MATTHPWRTRAFGLDLRFDGLEPPGAWDARSGETDDLVLTVAARSEAEAAWSGAEELGWEATIDGAHFAVERGLAGDHRFRRDGRTLAHLDPPGGTLLCTIDDRDATNDWRCLLDSVLFSVALLHGREGLHAGAVLIEGHAVAIAAGSGGGKSTLLAALLAGGAELISDDVTALDDARGTLVAHPGPPLMTVPGDLRRASGDPIATLGEESWTAVSVASAPARLGGVVILDRGAGGRARLEPIARPLAPLLSSLLRFPRSAERERDRFDLAATIAETTPVLALRAGPEVTPDELAATLRDFDYFDIDRGHG